MKFLPILLKLSLCITFFNELFADCQEQVLIQTIQILNPWEEFSRITVKMLPEAISNTAYRVNGHSTYFAKFSRNQPEMIGSSLENEFTILHLISHAQLSPKPLYFNEKEGLLITEFIDTNQNFIDVTDTSTLSNICLQLKNLHRLDVEFPTVFCPYEQVEILMKNALKAGAKIPKKYMKDLLKKANEWKKNALNRAKKTPCHLDLHSRNIIQDEKQLWLIDWEYAGQSDPYYDLAVLASAEKFSDKQMMELLSIYEGSSFVSDELKDHFWKMRILADTRWALWCYIQDALAPTDHSFKIHGDRYLNASMNRFEELYIVN